MGICTKRLILKAPSHDDFDNLVTLRTTPEVMRYVGDGNIQNPKKVKEVLDGNIAYYKLTLRKRHAAFLIFCSSAKAA